MADAPALEAADLVFALSYLVVEGEAAKAPTGEALFIAIAVHHGMPRSRALFLASWLPGVCCLQMWIFAPPVLFPGDLPIW